MNTVQEVVEYLEAELAEAYELHDLYKNKNPQLKLFYLTKATVLLELLEEIKN